jgi:hypothetical protein
MSETVSQAPTAEAPVSESKVETPVAEAVPVAEKPSSAKLLDLARKEAEFVKKEVARKEEIAKLQQQLNEYENEVGYYRKAKETYKSNPEALLNKLGITYDELTEAVIDYYDTKEKGQQPLDRDAIRKEIEAEFQKAEAARTEAATRAAVEGFVSEIQTFVEGNKEKFPHLQTLHKSFGESETPEQLIFSIVENYYEETGEMLDLETAAATAEEYFREEWNKLNGVLTKTPTTVVPSAPETPVQTKTENKVEAPKDTDTKPVNANSFVRKDVATITNNLSKRTYSIANNKQNVDRHNAIDRAVAAMEAAARRSR